MHARSRWSLLLVLAAMISAASLTNAAYAGLGLCPKACCDTEIQYVEKTVMCPVWTTETKTVTCTAYRCETRYREVTCLERVPETVMVTRTICDYVPEMRTREEQYTVCKPVVTEEVKEYTVRVPKWTEVEKSCPPAPCDPCGPEARTYTVRCCEMVPETRECVVKKCRLEEQVCTKEVNYTVCVPKTRQVQVPVTTCRLQRVTKKVPCVVRVPVQVRKTVCVPVCKMVAKKVCVPVCVAKPCCPDPCEPAACAPAEDCGCN